jgi:hypothetical protein
MVRLLALSLILLVFLGCDRSAPPDVLLVSEDSAGVILTQIKMPLDSVPSLELGRVVTKIEGLPDPGAQAPFLESVSAGAILSNGRVLVVDMRADLLHVYDSLGNHLETFGGSGEGPREFSWIRNLSVSDGDTLFAYDPHLRAVKSFHPDVGFLRSTPIPDPPGGSGGQVIRISAGRFVHFDSRYADPSQDLRTLTGSVPEREVHPIRYSAYLFLMDESGVLAGPVQFDGGYTGIVGGYGEVLAPFAPRPVISVRGGLLVYGSGETFELLIRDSIFDLRKKIEWPAFDKDLAYREVEILRDEFRLNEDPPQQGNAYSYMLSDALIPARRPSIQRSLIDAEGAIWVARFEPVIPAPKETEWYVLDSNGVPVGHLVFPLDGNPRLLDIRGNRVLICTIGELDVPDVRVFELNGPMGKSLH